MGRLRITVVTPEFPTREFPQRGRSVYQTIRHLCDYADVRAVCPLPRYPVHFRPKFDHRPADLSYSPPDVSALYLEYPAVPGVTRPLNGLMCAHHLEPHLRTIPADLILNFWLYPAGFAALNVGRKLGLPVVVGSLGSDLNSIPDPLSGWLTRKTLTGASRVIAKSEQLRRRAVAMGANPDTIHVVPNGCDEKLFFVRDRESARRDLNVLGSAKLIVFAGRMNRAKGIAELLDAVAVLSLTCPDLLLVYVGDGPHLPAMQEKACDAGLGERVRFVGACSSAEVGKWLAAANLLALPSYAEGCPNVVVEALSCGRPVVATRVGDLPELVDGSCGLLVPPRDVGALRNAFEIALHSVWDEHAIATRFRRSWDLVAQEVLAVCEASLSDARTQ